MKRRNILNRLKTNYSNNLSDKKQCWSLLVQEWRASPGQRKQGRAETTSTCNTNATALNSFSKKTRPLQMPARIPNPKPGNLLRFFSDRFCPIKKGRGDGGWGDSGWQVGRWAADSKYYTRIQWSGKKIWFATMSRPCLSFLRSKEKCSVLPCSVPLFPLSSRPARFWKSTCATRWESEPLRSFQKP